MTEYINRSELLFGHPKKYPIYKKCDKTQNRYFWRFDILDFHYVEPCNEVLTINNILVELPDKKSKFFEATLISFLLNEDESRLKTIHDQGWIDLNDSIVLVIPTLFSPENRKENSELSDKFKSELEPDYILYHRPSGEFVVIDAFDGANSDSSNSPSSATHKTKHPTRLDDKVRKYSSAYNTRTVVYWSPFHHQRVLNDNKWTFTFFEDDKFSSTFQFKNITINAAELTRLYKRNYMCIIEENEYWMRCERDGQIIKNIQNSPNRNMS